MDKTQKTEERFKALLRELFQFANADLNFGIYRVMNHKREEWNKFIDEKIVAAVDEALKQNSADGKTDNGDAPQDILRHMIISHLGKSAFDAKNRLKKDYHDTPYGKLWLALEKTLGKAAPLPKALRDEVFNRLYEFFSRYYDEGDFMCKRRHSAAGRYAIPYNGEEVLLHWANRDQYYIKTAEHFLRYEYKIGESKNAAVIRFEMREAQLPKDNNKANGKRYFIPLTKAFAADKDNGKVFVLPFEYRPLDKKEQLRWPQNSAQDTIIDEAVTALTATKTAAPFLTVAEDGELLIARHMRRYARRNTADYFIHKNLRRFLLEELDFYIKNEVLNAEEIASAEASGAGENTKARFIVAGATRETALMAIDFLAQMENFQKAIWEKKKFITQTEYCLTVGILKDNKLRDKIAACEGQWAEWRALNFCNGIKSKAKRLAFMDENPTLPLDTVHFDGEFKDTLLACFDDLEEITDGVLFHGENWQALNLMQEKYRGQVSCIHIDPPYNTATSGFLYKNDYQHSSWIAMMENRIALSAGFLSDISCYQFHIDENEQGNLASLLNIIFSDSKIETIVWDKRHPLGGSSKIAIQHEYIISFCKGELKLIKLREGADRIIAYANKLIKKHEKNNEELHDEFRAWMRKQVFFDGEGGFVGIDEKGPYQTMHMGAPEQRIDKKFFNPLIHPVTKKPCPVPRSGWSNTPEFMESLFKNDLIIFGEDENTQPRRKGYLSEHRITELSSQISDGSKGKKDIDKLGLYFSYCHPVNLYKKLIFASSNKQGLVLDYFAGSGTTAHAVININREDGGRRKFILVEMGEYFDTVLLPRIKKVIYTPEWKEGKPKRLVTKEEAQRAPRLLKYYRMESYDDALDNIAFDEEISRPLLKFDDYAPRYMLQTESRACATFVSNEMLKKPFAYTLRRADKEDKNADLPETFAYLIGLREKTRRIFHDGKRRYVVQTGEAQGRSTTVIWRDTDKWKSNDFEKDRDFVDKQKLTANAERVYVNDDSIIKGAQSLTPLFHSMMFPNNDDE